MSASILVVDDSPVDRRLVGGLLEEAAGWTVLYAGDGEEAIEQLKQNRVDLVVTDLLMAPMNGLGLVKSARQQFPLVPVILMTGLGNDSVAVQALRDGAASYVAKKRLAYDLLGTVRHVLTASVASRGEVELRNMVVCSQTTYSLENDLRQIDTLVAHLQDEVTRVAPVEISQRLRTSISMSESERLRVHMALYEALLNAFYHGNLEIGSGVSKEDRKDEAEKRRQEQPYDKRRIHVDTFFDSREARYVIRDEGPGFDPGRFWTSETDSLDQQFGRGLVLIRTIMDDVQFNEAGNEVTLVKRREDLADQR